jgi:hypothetical protein
MTPPTATGFSPSQIISMSLESVRSLPSRVVKGSPFGGGAHHDAVFGQTVEIERVKRLAGFHHDEVGDIHQIVDRPQPTDIRRS